MLNSTVARQVLANELRASPPFRALAGAVCICSVVAAALAVAMVVAGARPVGYLWALPLVLAMAWFTGVVALRGHVGGQMPHG